MRFEGILKGYLKAVATCSTGPVAGGSSIRKWEGNHNRGPVQISPVGSGFRSFSGPRNWTFKHYNRQSREDEVEKKRYVRLSD